MTPMRINKEYIMEEEQTKASTNKTTQKEQKKIKMG